MNLTYNSLFLVTLAAVISPWLSMRLFKGLVPAIVIEILVGILLGNSGFHLADPTKYVNFLANFGFSYLMFLSGLELDFDLLFTQPRGNDSKRQFPAWLKGFLFFAVTFVLSLITAYTFAALGETTHPFMVALILSTTSTGILTPALKGAGWLGAAFGQEVLLYGIIADIATLLLITGYVAFHTTGNAFSVLLVMVLLLAFVFLYRLLRFAQRFNHRFVSIQNATSELGLRGAFALILLFLALSVSLGTVVVVGAFLAGAIISLLSERHSILTQKLNSIGYGFLLPIFFVNVGLKFNVQALDVSKTFWIVLCVSLIVMFANKMLPALVFLRKFQFRQRLAGGALLSARLSLIIAASQIAAQIGMLKQSYATGFILLAIVTCLLSPVMFSRLLYGIQPPKRTKAEPETLAINKDTLPPEWTLAEIEVVAPNLQDVPMRALHLPPDMLIISIVRGDERIIPRGHTTLERFDVVLVIGDELAIDELRLLFSIGRPARL